MAATEALPLVGKIPVGGFHSTSDRTTPIHSGPAEIMPIIQEVGGVMYIVFEVERMEFNIPKLESSLKRNMHGPRLIISPCAGWFDTALQPPFTINLPCCKTSKKFTLDGPIKMKFPLRKGVDPVTVLNDPIVSFTIEIEARHCKSDQGESISHVFGNAVVPLAMFKPGTSKVEITAIDRAMEFEEMYAARFVATGHPPTDMAEMYKIRKEYYEAHAREPFNRMLITFHKPKLYNVFGKPWDGKFRAADRSENNAMNWDFFGEASGNTGPAQRLRDVFEAHKNSTFQPYGGIGEFPDYHAMHIDDKYYFVPTYRAPCGVDIPSAADLMLSWADQPPKERVLSHLLRAQLTIHGVTEEFFIRGCKELIGAQALWCNEAPASKRHGDPFAKVKQHNLKQGVDYPASHKASADAIKCLELMCAALISVPNATAYKTDFGEIETSAKVPGAMPSMTKGKFVKAIVTEQHDKSIERRRGCDCEDGSSYGMRLWKALVEHMGMWMDPLVILWASVMDLFVPMITKMNSGECHILFTLASREYAHMMAMVGLKTAQVQGRTPADIKKWEVGIMNTCFWPKYMYEHTQGSLGHRTDLHEHVLQGKSIQWPFLPVLYLEPTRKSPSNQTPKDFTPCSNPEELIRQREYNAYKCDKLREFCRKHVALQSIEPHLTYPNHMSYEEACVPDAPLSIFYRRHLMGCMICPVFKITHREVLQSACTGSISTPMTHQLLSEGTYFLDLAFNDRRKPKTFGVAHVHTVSGDGISNAVPFAPIDREFLVWMSRVRASDVPIVIGDIPAHLHGLHHSLLGKAEPIPHLVRHATAKVHVDKGTITMSGAHASSFMHIEFIPHDGKIIEPHDVIDAFGKVNGGNHGGLVAMRIPLIVAHMAPMIKYPPDVMRRLVEMHHKMGLENMDPCELTAYLEREQLERIARERGILGLYTTHEWDLYRHWLGDIACHRPIYVNYLAVLHRVF